jgi:hypothetical protein
VAIFCQETKKSLKFFSEYFVLLTDIAYLCSEMDEWWGFDKPFFCS